MTPHILSNGEAVIVLLLPTLVILFSLAKLLGSFLNTVDDSEFMRRRRRKKMAFERQVFNVLVYGRLLEYAKALRLPVKHTFLPISTSGTFNFIRFDISIDSRFIGKAWTLAHELGHFHCIRHWGDFTEEAADQEGIRIINTVLTPSERERFELFIRELEAHVASHPGTAHQERAPS